MNYQQILGYVVDVILFLVHVVSLILCSRGIHTLCKHDLTSISEVKNMKYRLPHYRDLEKAESQSFNPLVTQYRFNKATNELEELPDKLDVQKLVDSSLTTALEAMFDKYLSPLQPSSSELVIEDNRDTLDRLSDAMAFADELRQKYGMSDFSTLQDISSRLEDDIKEKELQLKKEKEAKDSEAADALIFEKFKAFMAKQEGQNNEA